MSINNILSSPSPPSCSSSSPHHRHPPAVKRMKVNQQTTTLWVPFVKHLMSILYVFLMPFRDKPNMDNEDMPSYLSKVSSSRVLTKGCVVSSTFLFFVLLMTASPSTTTATSIFASASPSYSTSPHLLTSPNGVIKIGKEE